MNTLRACNLGALVKAGFDAFASCPLRLARRIELSPPLPQAEDVGKGGPQRAYPQPTALADADIIIENFRPNGVYEAACGQSFLLSASKRDLLRLGRVEGLEGVADVPKNEPSSFLANVIGKATADKRPLSFNEAGGGAAVCEIIAAIRSGHSRIAVGSPGAEQGSSSFSTFHDHPGEHLVTQVDHYTRPENRKNRTTPPAEKYGASPRLSSTGAATPRSRNRNGVLLDGRK
ncbi:hypothetical protein ABIG04_009388 [Bradyrhizobium japonicum]